MLKRIIVFTACMAMLVRLPGQAPDNDSAEQEYKVIIGTFLGSSQRNYYGNQAPDTLEVIWKHYLGKGETIISRKLGSREWAGAGWTGLPLLVEENGELFLIQDLHTLR